MTRKVSNGCCGSVQSSRAFTLVELLVVIGIIAVLVGVLLPALSKARAAASKVKCAANLRSMGQAIYVYAAGNKGKMPMHPANGPLWLWDVPTETCDQLLRTSGASKQGGNRSMFYCPEFSEQEVDELWNYNGFRVIGYFLLTTRVYQNGNQVVPRTGTVGAPNPSEFCDLDILGLRHFIDSLHPSVPQKIVSTGASVKLFVPTHASDMELATDAIIYRTDTTKWATTGGWGGGQNIHMSSHQKNGIPTGANILFLDGHVDWRTYKYQNALSGGDIRRRATAGGGAASNPQFWF